MEVALSGPEIHSEPPRRGAPLPLSQLVEQSSSRASIPNHLLESKIYAKLRSNSQIQAEPSELHFSGFELGKDYVKILKLINVSSEVMNIHVIPTLTKYFQTSYNKKHRLIPGLAYTLKVRFCPDEWRYFYDCIRVHCKGEENLLIPVHAYPVIDDLHIPSRIDLSAVPLGQSVCHAIPLRCSCPIDFEFQVFVIQPHEAFYIHPLTGVIPAGGGAKITVTFTPLQYETSQVTFQLVVSQFNTKPYLCTITGSSAPHLALRHAVPAECNGSRPAVPRRSKTRCRSKKADELKTHRDQGDVKHGLTASLDVCTPAGVAKMLIKDINKLNSKDLKQALSCGSVAGLQSRQIKEALFMKKVQKDVKEEQANHLKWQVHLGVDPMSEQTRRQVVEEREMALHEYMVKRGDVRLDEDFDAGRPKLSSQRVLCDAGQVPEGVPSFQFYTDIQWELRKRALRLFQQAARRVVIRCRMNRRLSSLKKLADTMKNLTSMQKAEERTHDLKISPDKVFLSSFPIFCNEDDPLVLSDLITVPVDAVNVTLAAHVPFFKLQVPQHYKLRGYQPVSAWEAFNSHIPTTLARPLRTGAPDELGIDVPRTEEEHVAAAALSFVAPDALLRPFAANPLRIFNPAPDIQTYKPDPKYLESELEFHLCLLPRYTLPKSNTRGSRTQIHHNQKMFHKEAIAGVKKWKNFDAMFLNHLSNQPALTGDSAPRRSVDYNTDILPLTVPPPPAALPDDPALLMDTPAACRCEGSGVQLTPEMIRADFLSGEAPVANSNLTAGVTARHQREMEVTHRPEISKMGQRVTARLEQNVSFTRRGL
ncbi:cilia- and flagella-associated protein 221 [Odontesthes bonariensis]|uniref:cilia- and flagella-associated protein 221 n=1 Tax=Odontesthes bonariensis TaxID=219752 RepID=UPI003F58FB7A